MKNTKNYLFAAACVLLASSLTAQKQTPPAGGTPKDFKVPAKSTTKLPNGLRTTMVQYGEIPKVTIRLIIKAGNAHEKANQVWLADLMGQMMKQGTPTMDFKTLAKKVAGMGGEVNISVGPDETTISGSVLSEFAPDLVKVIADLVMNPAFPQSELDRIKNDLKRSLAVQQSVPQNQATAKFYKIIYKDQSYGNYFPTEEMINSYTLPMVKDFYNKNIGAKRAVLYVAGKFDPATLQAAVKNNFSKWKAGNEIYYPVETPSIVTDTVIIDRKNAPQTTIIMGLPTLSPKHTDYVAATVANSLLGGSFGSRITSNIREDKGYTYSPYSTLSNRKNGSLWMEQADVTGTHTIDALKEITKEIKLLQNEPPSAKELEGIQNYEAGVFVLINSSPSGIISQLSFLDRYNLPDSYLSNYVKNVYKVTPAKVSEIARDHYKVEKMTVVLVGDKESIEKQSANN
jgi:predicted Zn-dependent peptidase